MRKIFVLVAAAAALTTAACNTVEGVGRDTQAAGSAVSGAAQEMSANDDLTYQFCSPETAGPSWDPSAGTVYVGTSDEGPPCWPEQHERGYRVREVQRAEVLETGNREFLSTSYGLEARSRRSVPAIASHPQFVALPAGGGPAMEEAMAVSI